MGTENILREMDEGVLELSFDRSGKKNAIDRPMYGALVDALDEAASDPKVRVVLFLGRNGDFTSGNDIADFLNPATFTSDSPVMRFISAISEAQKPLVAGVEGLAVGIGVTMLLHCDLVYAGRGARFQMPFTGLGLVPEAGSTLLLPAIVGRQRAAELVLLGEAVDAEKARDYGFVNEVVADGEATSRARAAARALARKAPAAIRLSKKLLRHGEKTLLEETIARESAIFRERLSSPEAAEAFSAFAQKRKPDFSRFE
ncbi:MAG TPA: enoyl-CoA hydratase [Rectinemataceae bacterium]|nr:enoyl-CoA hydratase [Rectinemataceae bacterium]